MLLAERQLTVLLLHCQNVQPIAATPLAVVQHLNRHMHILHEAGCAVYSVTSADLCLPELYVLLKPASADCFIVAVLLVFLMVACGFSAADGLRAGREVLPDPIFLY